jgi:hypothetical protein
MSLSDPNPHVNHLLEPAAQITCTYNYIAYSPRFPAHKTPILISDQIKRVPTPVAVRLDQRDTPSGDLCLSVNAKRDVQSITIVTESSLHIAINLAIRKEILD